MTEESTVLKAENILLLQQKKDEDKLKNELMKKRKECDKVNEDNETLIAAKKALFKKLGKLNKEIKKQQKTIKGL